jgi:hypothetical protein
VLEREDLWIFSCHTIFEVGDGSKIKFWHDQWCGDVALKEAFSDLFDIACAKDAFVAPHKVFLGVSNKWNMTFARAAHDWEVDVFGSFFKVLYSARVRQGSEDKQ